MNSGNADDGSTGGAASDVSASTGPSSVASSAGASADGTDPVAADGADPVAAEGTEPVEAVGADVALACRTRLQAAEAVVQADRQGITHLKTHIGAHEAWVTGQIDEVEKSATYKATRLAGPGDLARHAKTEEAYSALKADDGDPCKALSGPCTARMRALTASMAAGAMGIDHWQEHLTNMADFAAGEFEADRAQALWDETRDAMPAMTAPWNKAERGLKAAPRCTQQS